MSDEKQVQGDVQGMYAQVVGGGIEKMTVTMPHVSMTTYGEVNLLGYKADNIMRAFKRVAHYSGVNLDGERFNQDFSDLLKATEKTHKTRMHLLSGDKVETYVVKNIVQREDDKFLEMSPYRKEWWMDNPHLSPIIESIHEYLPDFKPWHMLRDKYISILRNSGSLTVRG